MEWNREKTLELIREYKKRPGLWDMTNDDYRKKEIKQKLLMEVSASMGANVPILEIEKKFHTLRTQYHREINRMKRKEPYNSKWFGFKSLEFLSSPKACRSSKTRSKSDLKDDTTTLTTSYLIREAVPQHDNSGGGANEGNNISEQFITIQRNSTSRSHELEKLIEETTKDVEDVDDPKSKLTIKEITVPLHHNHGYHTSSTGGSELSSGEHDQLQQQDIHQQHHQVEEGVIEMHDNDEITYQPANSTGATPTTTLHHHHHQGMPTRIIKIQRRDACPEENYYEEGHQQAPHIHTHTAVSSAGGKRIYYEANGQQHTATILAAPSPNSGNTSGTVLLNSTNNKLHSQLPSRNSLTITQVHPQSPPNSSNSLTNSPQQQVRDDYSIYGEYVANEMRCITNREILIALKHKINTALFEANMAEIQK